MQPTQWEVIILKPTPVFLSFLASQLPDVELPDLSVLQTDSTAYVIDKQPNDDETLKQIERHFATMFRHEIARFLGEDSYNEIESSFLDFLCCFRFELHSQIVLMEQTMKEGQQLLRVKPRTVLLNWMKESVAEQADLISILERVNLSHLAENATVVVKNFDDIKTVKPFLHDNFKPIFETEMLRMCDRADEWPQVNNFDDFIKHFNVEIHTQLVHLH